MPSITKTEPEMPIDELWTRLIWLPAHTKLFSQLYKEEGWIEGKGTWYKTQQEHWSGWLLHYTGPGAYGRKKWEGRDAKFVYNNIKNAQMHLWIGEAAGIPEEIVAAAIAAYHEAKPRGLSAQAGAVRKIMPWEMVKDALLKIELTEEQLEGAEEQAKKIHEQT